MLSQPQRIALARLLALLRPDWESAGVHSAVVTLADSELPPFSACRQAIDRAAIASNRFPTCISFTEQYPPAVLAQDRPVCEAHGGNIRRSDGRWHCCVVEDVWPDDETRQVTPRALPLTAAEIIAGLALRGTQHQKSKTLTNGDAVL